MATIDSPTNPAVSVEIEPTFRTLRVVQRPIDYEALIGGVFQNVGGHYKYATSIVAMAPATSANLFSFRHLTANTFSVIMRVSMLINVQTAITAQAMTGVGLVKVTGFTGDFTTNQTTISPVSPLSAMRSSMLPPTIRLQGATAAAGMTGGVFTQAVDNTVGALSGLTAIGTSNSFDLLNWNASSPGSHPLVLAANEGFLVQWGVALNSGTILPQITYEWAEVPSF